MILIQLLAATQRTPRNELVNVGVAGVVRYLSLIHISLTAIFGHDLVKQPRFTQAVHAAYRALLEKGAKATVAHYLVQLKK